MFASKKPPKKPAKKSPKIAPSVALSLASNTESSAETQPLVQMANILKHRHYIVGSVETGMYNVNYIAHVIEFYCRILSERLDQGNVTSTSGANWLNNQLPITNTPTIEVSPERFFALLESVVTHDPLGHMQEYTPLIRNAYARFHELMG